MIWRLGHRASKEALPLADRHYNRQKPGSPQFVPPGRCVVLMAGDPVAALFVMSWPFAEYTRHAWAGAWVNSLFRNEGAGLSSELILEAIAADRWVWGDPPPEGIITFVDASKVRRKRDPGRCYKKAGFSIVGTTKTNNLLAFHLPKENAPDPVMPSGAQLRLWS